ncbi:MAG: hypothetical protein LH650_03865 [Chloroflexi bacterium]|nr:hypothetical protein [Chloroflexota bacterium]
MSELGDDLKATAQAIIKDADRIGDIEDAKLGLDAADPLVLTLAREAETIAEDLFLKAAVEREIATEAADEAASAADQATQRPSR